MRALKDSADKTANNINSIKNVSLTRRPTRQNVLIEASETFGDQNEI